LAGEATPEEIVQSVEAILCKPQQKRRHRKSHGRISFGDLARTIADAWKTVSPKARAIFDHYAERDSMRYKRELKQWKERKEMELEASTMVKHSNFMNNMNMSSSMRSNDGSVSTSDYLDSLPREGGGMNQQHPFSSSWNAGRSFSSFNSSMNSIDPQSLHMSGESGSIQQAFQRQQQILQQQLMMDTSLPQPAGSVSSAAVAGLDGGIMPPGTNAFHSSFSSLPARMSYSDRMSPEDTGLHNFGMDSAISEDGPSMDGPLPPLRRMRSMSDVRPNRCDMGQASFGSVVPQFQQQQQQYQQQQQQQVTPGETMSIMSAAGANMQPSQNSSQQSAHLQQKMLEIERMQQKLEWLQEQQRKLQQQQQMQQQQMQQQQFMPMGNASATSLQLVEALQGSSTHLVSDNSRSMYHGSMSTENANSSYSTTGHASFGAVGGSFARSHQYQQPLSHDDSISGMISMSGSGRGSVSMNISNNTASGGSGRGGDRPDAEPADDFWLRNVMDMDNDNHDH